MQESHKLQPAIGNAKELPSIFDDEGDWADEETAEIFTKDSPEKPKNITSIKRKTIPPVRDRVREELLRMQLMFPLNDIEITYIPNDPKLPHNDLFPPIQIPSEEDNPFTSKPSNDLNPFTP